MKSQTCPSCSSLRSSDRCIQGSCTWCSSQGRCQDPNSPCLRCPNLAASRCAAFRCTVCNGKCIEQTDLCLLSSSVPPPIIPASSGGTSLPWAAIGGGIGGGVMLLALCFGLGTFVLCRSRNRHQAVALAPAAMDLLGLSNEMLKGERRFDISEKDEFGVTPDPEQFNFGLTDVDKPSPATLHLTVSTEAAVELEIMSPKKRGQNFTIQADHNRVKVSPGKMTPVTLQLILKSVSSPLLFFCSLFTSFFPPGFATDDLLLLRTNFPPPD